jgi:hypothetical protein
VVLAESQRQFQQSCASVCCLPARMPAGAQGRGFTRLGLEFHNKRHKVPPARTTQMDLLILIATADHDCKRQVIKSIIVRMRR